MNSATLQIEVAQLGLVQRNQKYQDAAALKLIEGVASTPEVKVAPPPHAPPIEPVAASPRDGSSLHVVA